MARHAEHYILATGARDVQRLRLLHEAYGPGTEAALRHVGLRPGMRVVEVGWHVTSLAGLPNKLGLAAQWSTSTIVLAKSSKRESMRSNVVLSSRRSSFLMNLHAAVLRM